MPSFALLLVYGVLLLFLCCCAVVVIVILLLFEVLLGFCCYFYFCFILFCLFVCLFSFNQLKLGVVFPKPGGEKATQLLLTLRLLYSSSMVLQWKIYFCVTVNSVFICLRVSQSSGTYRVIYMNAIRV